MSGTSSGDPATEAWVIVAGVLDQALDGAERFGEREDLGRVGDPHGRLRCRRRVTVKRHHPAEVAHLLRGGGVTGVVGELRVQHALDGGVTDEQVDDRPGVLAVAVHPHGERLHAAQHEVAVERGGDGAGRVLREAQPVGERVVVRRATKPPTTSL